MHQQLVPIFRSTFEAYNLLEVPAQVRRSIYLHLGPDIFDTASNSLESELGPKTHESVDRF